MPSLRSGTKRYSTVILIAVRRYWPPFKQHLSCKIAVSFWVCRTRFSHLLKVGSLLTSPLLYVIKENSI
jgi:hypothetical protein